MIPIGLFQYLPCLGANSCIVVAGKMTWAFFFHGVLEPSWMLEQLASALAFWPAGMSSGPFAHGFSLLPRKGFEATFEIMNRFLLSILGPLALVFTLTLKGAEKPDSFSRHARTTGRWLDETPRPIQSKRSSPPGRHRLDLCGRFHHPGMGRVRARQSGKPTTDTARH